MTLNSRRHRRARDQCPIVIKGDPLVSDRDNDLERTLRSVLELILPSLNQILCAGVVVFA